MQPSVFGEYSLRRPRTRVNAETGEPEGEASLARGETMVAKAELKDGEVILAFKKKAEEYHFLRFIATLPIDAFDEIAEDRESLAAQFIIALFDRGHESEWLKKRCRQGTVFRLLGDPENEWRLLNMQFSRAVAMQLRADIGEELEQIANEEIASWV